MRSCAVLFVLGLLLGVNSSIAYEIGFDCGGGGCSNDGRVFLADTPYPGSQDAGYVGGLPRPKISQSNSGGPFQPVYICDDYRYGNFSYQFAVPDGEYAVTLYFNEFQFHGPGLRQFSIDLEGLVHAEAFDIHARARMFYAFSARFLTSVTDGVLDVTFTPGTGDAILAAIAVQDIVDDGQSPANLTGLGVTGSYNANVLTWNLPDDPDASGVKIYRAPTPSGPFSVVATRDDLAPFWVDHAVQPGVPQYYRVTVVDLYGRESGVSGTPVGSPLDPDTSTLPMYEITIDPDSLAILQANYLLDTYYQGSFAFGAATWDTVGLRYRGSLNRKISSKKSWKVNFYNGADLDDKDPVNINSDFQDYTMVGPAVSFINFRDAQCLVSEAAKANLLVNDEYRGIFTEIEGVDEKFLERRGVTQIGNVYKARASLQLMPPQGYVAAYEKKTNVNSGWDDLVELVETINYTPVSEIDDLLFPMLEVDKIIDYYAMRIFFGDDDFFWQNYYLYHHLSTDKWEIIPWDLDHSFQYWQTDSPINLGTRYAQSVNGWNYLFDKLLQVPKYRRRYCDRLQEFMDYTFEQTRFEAVVDSVAAVVEPDVDRDFWKLRFDDHGMFDGYLDLTKNFRGQRINYLSSAIAPYLADINGLFVNELLVINDSVVADDVHEYDSYIELYNWTDSPVQLSDYCLTDGQGDPLDDVLPDQIIAPRGFALFWADGQPEQGPTHLNFTLPVDSGSLMLYRTDNLTTAVDSLVYSTQVTDVAYGVQVDGWWPFTSMPPTPEAANVQFETDVELKLNEFMAVNNFAVQDPQGQYDDWVELYNPGDQMVDLSGYFLTDDLANPAKWRFPDGTSIPPFEFLVVWCDEDTLDAGLHASFKLSGGGEALGVCGPAALGHPILDTHIFGTQIADVSNGRFPDGSGAWMDMPTPTPGAPNYPGMAVEEGPVSESRFALYPAYPNPVSGSTTIGFSIDGTQTTDVSLELFDIRGRRVRSLVTGLLRPGPQSVTWNRCDDDGNPLPSGMYFSRLSAAGRHQTRKIILLR